MRYFLLLLILSLALSSYAQDEGWPIVENCLGELPYPTIPQANWDFEGVIFGYGDAGVRGIRTDLNTSYIVAFEDDENFTQTGSFSPDGNWFAYLTGEIRPSGDLVGTRNYIVTGIAVVSGNPQQQSNYYQLPEEYWSFSRFVSGIPYPMYFNRIVWLDNENLIYTGSDEKNVYVHLNISTGEMIEESLGDSFPARRISSYIDWVALDNGNYITQTFENNVGILGIFNVSGELVEEITQGHIEDVSLSSQGQTIAFLKQNRIYLAHLDTQTIEDLCLENMFHVYATYVHFRIIWSPDGNYLAFLYDGYPVLINLETREIQVLRYRTLTLMGWYLLTERYD